MQILHKQMKGPTSDILFPYNVQEAVHAYILFLANNFSYTYSGGGGGGQ
jgi:hypothetical protein